VGRGTGRETGSESLPLSLDVCKLGVNEGLDLVGSPRLILDGLPCSVGEVLDPRGLDPNGLCREGLDSDRFGKEGLGPALETGRLPRARGFTMIRGGSSDVLEVCLPRFCEVAWPVAVREACLGWLRGLA